MYLRLTVPSRLSALLASSSGRAPTAPPSSPIVPFRVQPADAEGVIDSLSRQVESVGDMTTGAAHHSSPTAYGIRIHQALEVSLSTPR